MTLDSKNLPILLFVLFVLQNAIAQGLVPETETWGKWLTLVVSSTSLYLGFKGVQIVPLPPAQERPKK